MIQAKGVQAGVDVICLVLLSFYIIGGAAIVPFHGDESSKIYVGRDFYFLFLEGDREKLTHQAKRSASSGEYRANLASGSISNMIYGWLAASGGYAITELNDDWHWGRDYKYNMESNRVPDARLLQTARLALAAQLAAAATLFYVFARITINRPTALLASLLFAAHPTLLLNGRRALQEGSHMLGIMLVLLAAAWLLRQRRWRGYALLGACAGLAIAIKHTSALLVALVFLAIAGLSVYESLGTGDTRNKLIMRPLAGILMTGIVTLLVFYLLNPGWWDAPLETAGDVMSERSALLQRQAGVYGGYQSLGQQAKGFFRFVLIGEAQYFEDKQWAGYAEISEQIRIYESSGWAGATIGGNAIAALVMLALVSAGIIMLVRDRDISFQNRALLLFWGGGTAAIVFALTPLPWARYYLPVLPFVLMMAAYALTSMAGAMRERIDTARR
ncbi:MAG: glycosyltransferase family 39 protein [Chloroflexi bacterium]|nr:glycosyltransferase family 39 protein [Chloroflexota bacterium]